MKRCLDCGHDKFTYFENRYICDFCNHSGGIPLTQDERKRQQKGKIEKSVRCWEGKHELCHGKCKEYIDENHYGTKFIKCTCDCHKEAKESR